MLRQELYDRGFDHLAQTAASRDRATRWLNQAYLELCLEERWPFRLTTTSGAAPLTIGDVDAILTVIDSDNNATRLYEMTEAELTAFDLSATGSNALWFYRDSLIVHVWPASGATLSVRYWSVPVELVAGSDETVVPERYANVIVDGAVMRAASDRDNPAAVDLAERMYQRGLALMRRQLLVAPTHIELVPGVSEDD
ncbi:MAG TPA: hypothetical protein VE645_19200 [Pseudonocardiaceae bacterium]|nr:hypothetical protein [Pseudonocardiaceae bacterium]